MIVLTPEMHIRKSRFSNGHLMDFRENKA